MSTSLLKKLTKKSKLQTDVLKNSKFFKHALVPTSIPLLNVALSGDFNGGLSSGILMVSGESKTFKTGFLVQLAKAHQDVYKKRSLCILVDSEFSPLEYWENAGVDTNAVMHVPVRNVEEMKSELAGALAEIEEHNNELPEDKHTKVIIIVDSLGGLASLKEATDAEEGKVTADMTRARAINSFFRIVTPYLNILDIPMCLVTSHYMTMDKYPKRVYAGGKKSYLSSDDVWYIKRVQEKDGTEITGHEFIICIDKSRTIKEGAEFPIGVTYKDGIDKYSGIFGLAVEGGFIQQKGAWYKTIDPETGEVGEKSLRRVEVESPEFCEDLLKNEKFLEFVKEKYRL